METKEFEQYLIETFINHKAPENPDLSIDQKIIELKRVRLELKDEGKWMGWVIDNLQRRKWQLESDLADELIRINGDKENGK